jgi:hypothetical protein
MDAKGWKVFAGRPGVFPVDRVFGLRPGVLSLTSIF